MALIMIVDDDEAHVQAMSHFIGSLGFETFSATDALTAVMRASQRVPSLIVLDFEMPAGDGARVYERIRGLSQTEKVPIIFISALGAEEVQRRVGGEAPNVRFLSKPVDISELLGCIEELLPGSTPGN